MTPTVAKISSLLYWRTNCATVWRYSSTRSATADRTCGVDEGTVRPQRPSTSHFVHLVDDLLDVARIATGKIKLNAELVKPRDVVNLVLDACRPEAERKSHRMTVIDETDSGLAVRGDAVQLTQVVSNLLSNTTKYMDAGGCITVRIARESEHALIEVSDTGIGIPTCFAAPRV
ncbi:Two-component hybrid sensor and regulator [Candidatus Paraburkholderia calva]|nr:Two-component hybrid sensor and regulator [Candidatus Paraburkholderia calva]